MERKVKPTRILNSREITPYTLHGPLEKRSPFLEQIELRKHIPPKLSSTHPEPREQVRHALTLALCAVHSLAHKFNYHKFRRSVIPCRTSSVCQEQAVPRTGYCEALRACNQEDVYTYIYEYIHTYVKLCLYTIHICTHIHKSINICRHT